MSNVIQIFQVLGYFAAAAVAIVYIRSAVVRAAKGELSELADTRGERIDDLEKHIARLEQETASKIAHLQGQLDAALGLKTQEIVEGVVEGLTPFLVGGR